MKSLRDFLIDNNYRIGVSVNKVEKFIAMFFVGFGLTFIEMVGIYSVSEKPAIVSVLLFFAFSLFNGFLFMEAIDTVNKKTR